MNRQIYLDYNASTPLAPEVAEAMRPFLSVAYGNPSSLHWAGSPARDAVEKARSQVAALLCCDATEVIFTSGGTEANNYAIKGAFFSAKDRGAPFHIITSCIEHPAVLEPCRFLQALGAEITLLRVDRFGVVDPDDVRRAIRPHTRLITIMHANNEVGTIQPIGSIAAIARDHGIPFHTDAAQSAGKVSVDVESLSVDLLSIAGHKLYGPKGVGVLFVREGVPLEPLLHGAGHESGRRAGTENILEIVGLGAACEVADECVDRGMVRQLRDEFWERLRDEFGDRIVLNGHPVDRLPNTLNVSFLDHAGYDVLAQLPSIAASTGSACHAGAATMSPVLAAMGASFEVGRGAVRFSLGRITTGDDINAAIDLLAGIQRTDGKRNMKPLSQYTPDEIKTAVAERYSSVATSPDEKFNFPVGRKFAESVGYVAAMLDSLPRGMWESFTGAGNPQAYVDARPGETVLDLGCGAALDLYLYSQKVGQTGKLYGLDLSADMLSKARRNLLDMGVANVEWLNASADRIPLPDSSVDLVTANGIYNLSPDKDAVMREVARVLKPGGRKIFAEIVLKSELPNEVRSEIKDWFRCIGGALVEGDFLQRLVANGLTNPEILWLGRNSRTGHELSNCAVIRAEKGRS